MRQALDALLKQPMTRKQFLARVGLVFLAIIGVSSFLRALGESNQHSLAARDANATSVDSSHDNINYGGKSG